MKSLLKRVLTPHRYRSLLRLKYETFPQFKRKLGQFPFLIAGSIIKVFPERSLITLKSRINVVRKMDYEHRDIFLNIDSDFEYRARLSSAKREPETVEWIETYLREGDVFFDVGANIGAYSLVASKFFYGKIKVYAFEPAFLNFTQLCKNISVNGCQGGIVPLQIALSDKTGIETFNYSNLEPGGAVHALGDAVDAEGYAFVPVAQQSVLGYRLDDLIQAFNIPIPNHIKIDVDGIEFSVLKGMEESLDHSSMRSIILELNEGRGDGGQIIDFLKGKGFESRSGQGRNCIFLRSESS